jgi:hypothetical protein
MAVLRLGHEALELAEINGGGHVEDRSRRAGEGEAVAVADVSAVEARPVNLDSGADGGPLGWDRDVDVAGGWVGNEVPEGAGGLVAEGCAWSTRKQSGHFRRLPRRDCVADEVDASVDLVEAAVLQSAHDLPGRNPGLEQLPPRHHPVLAPSDRGNDPVDSPSEGLTTYTVFKSSLDLGAP